MGAGSGFVLGGLLQGLGQGVSNLYEERRQNALAALKRQEDVEDRDAKIAGAQDIAQIQTQGRKEVISLTGEENRKTEELKGRQRLEEIKTKGEQDIKVEGVKFSNQKQLDELGANLDIKKDKASQLLKKDIDGGQVDHIDAADDGSMIVTYKNGTVVKKNIKLREKTSSSDDDEGSISAELNGRNQSGGGAAQPAAQPAAKTAAKPKWSDQDETVLRTRYANATPENAPRLFRNGKKLPLDEVRRMLQGL